MLVGMARRPPAAGAGLDEDELGVGPAPHHAAGLPAVRSALAHAITEMGVARTARMLAAVNQRDGFDCMGCAWPDPDRRHHAEFCENGAKAAAPRSSPSSSSRTASPPDSAQLPRSALARDPVRVPSSRD